MSPVLCNDQARGCYDRETMSACRPQPPPARNVLWEIGPAQSRRLREKRASTPRKHDASTAKLDSATSRIFHHFATTIAKRTDRAGVGARTDADGATLRSAGLESVKATEVRGAISPGCSLRTFRWSLSSSSSDLPSFDYHGGNPEHRGLVSPSYTAIACANGTERNRSTTSSWKL